MRLKDLEKYEKVTIQCHDNPDADALGSGYGLYCYFKEKGKQVRLIYSGRNEIQKPNLILMKEKLQIPVEYVEKSQAGYLKGLLIMTDCQYGAGNTTRFEADAVAVIDHHQPETEGNELTRIQPNVGSCSTLVWKMMQDERFSFEGKRELGTALYYGLYTDTNQFTELYNPLDLDMREAVEYDKAMITLFRNSNLSLKELEVAGIAMLRYIYNDDYRFALIKAQPCDPNILGLISDFLLQVDGVDVCIVYNDLGDGYKLSVRSCIKEVRANELAEYLTLNIGSGGGHDEKAGGFISMRLYEKYYPTTHSEAYISNKMKNYFEETDVIYAKNHSIKVEDMKKFQKRQIPVGYVKADEILPNEKNITIRTMKGDLELAVHPDLYIMIGLKGEVSPITREVFEQLYEKIDRPYCLDDCDAKTEYVPTIRDSVSGAVMPISKYASVCIPTKQGCIYAKPLSCRTKVFTAWDEERYLLGTPGDYLAVRCSDIQEVYIIEKEIFEKSYEEKLY